MRLYRVREHIPFSQTVKRGVFYVARTPHRAHKAHVARLSRARIRYQTTTQAQPAQPIAAQATPPSTTPKHLAEKPRIAPFRLTTVLSIRQEVSEYPPLRETWKHHVQLRSNFLKGYHSKVR